MAANSGFTYVSMFVSERSSLTESSQLATTSNTPSTPKTQRPKLLDRKGGQLSAIFAIPSGHQLNVGMNRQMRPNRNVGANIRTEDIPQYDNSLAIEAIPSIIILLGNRLAF